MSLQIIPDADQDDGPSIPGFEVGRCLRRRPARFTYLARQVALERTVLMRVWHCEAGDPAELLSDAVLSHPNCAATYAAGELPPVHLYQAVELVRGTHLGQWLSSPLRLGWPDVLRLATLVCDVLVHAHGRGVFHGTLHPRRLWFTDADVNSLRLGGFGQSSVLLRDPGDTTPLAPETSHEGRVDERSDVYGVGLLLFAMLTGAMPFVGTDRQQMLRRQGRGPGPLERADVPRELCGIIRDCLAPCPDERPPTVEALSSCLHRVWQTLEELPDPDCSQERLWRATS